MTTNEKIFYACGIVLAISALVVSFAGLKMKNFPGKAMPAIILWFVVFVVAATTFATRYSSEEHEAKAAEYAEFNEEIEKGETSGPYENEGGAQGGETEESEEEAEKEAEGSVQGDEPIGPTEGSQEGEGGQTPEPRGAEDEPTQSSEGPGGAEASATTLKLAADPAALAFDKDSLTAKAGKVTIDFDNPSAIPHNVVIEEDGKELAGFEPITEGEKAASADLGAGTYTYYCSVPGHREAGMEGELTVE